MSSPLNVLSRVGAERIHPTLLMTGFAVRLAGDTLRHGPHLLKRFRFLLDQMYQAGVKSTPVVLFVSFFIGMIVALQVGLELARFGQENSIGLLVAVTMTREMAPFITAIILAASVVSSLAAELGTMRVQDELTALEVLSIDTTSFLVVPRIFSLTLIAPILTILADLVGILGGGIIATKMLGLDFDGYLLNARESLENTGQWIPVPIDVYSGLLKATVFGFAIAVVGCAAGLQTRGGARGVGETVRSAVRNSIILIIVLNFVLGKLLHH